ncbi:MAG: sensor histidine kinase [Vallitaleaceae bacterium]|nr:sensor histidine kinase [Vallitaleaceae bacterium]
MTMKGFMKIKDSIKGTYALSFAYFLFGGIGIFIVGFLLFSSLSMILTELSIDQTDASLSQSGKYLEVYIDRLKTTSSLVSHHSDVVDYFSHKKELSDEQYESRIQRFISDVIESDKTLKSIILISKDGKIFSNEKELTMSMSEDMMKEEWYVNAIHSELPKLTSARMQSFSMDKDLWVISLSEEIVDEEGNNIGVAVIDIPYTTLEGYLMGLHLGDGGYAFILNEDNKVVFHQDSAYYSDVEQFDELVTLKNTKNDTLIGDDTLVSQYKINNTDWTLVGVCKIDAIIMIRRQIIETILFGFAVILLGVVITSALLRKLTKELSKREEDLHAQQMNALYSQINPHFLYNTLDTIVWMAEFNQSEDVIATTKSLAQFFRLSLNRGENLTTLRDEIEHVKQYLYIQKQRYQEKLAYEFDLDESLYDVLVPKIILQPIVENSIYHGLQEREEGGKICIRCKRITSQSRDFIIEIEDNGIGFEYNNNIETLPESTKTRLGGVGLKNVQQRIQLLYGKAYGLKVESIQHQGTKVTLMLKEMNFSS